MAFGEWMTFKGTKVFRDEAADAYTYVTDHAAVDADGAPNAYHPDDVGKNCQHDPHIGLDCPANAGYGVDRKSWWNQVLVPDPADPSKAYVQPSGEFAGFLVAMTWLADPALGREDINKYVDSRTVPYIVMPGSEFPAMPGTGSRGDVGYARHLGNGKSTSFIIADKGGGSDAKLGEGSIALFERLGGGNIDPRNARGVARGDVRYVVFRNSRHRVPKPWPRTQADIDAQVAGLLAGVGGLDAIRT